MEAPRIGFNRWDLLHPAVGRGGLTASVVVPFFERPESIAQVLAALRPQLESLDQVIVVDDGSRPAQDRVAVPPGMLVKVLRRPPEGFALAAARNEGADTATGDVLVFLDDDMIPDPSWLDSHMKWHAAYDGLLTVGTRRHVDPSQPDSEGEEPVHVANYLAWTNDLTAPADDLFRICSGGNLGLRHRTFQRLGGFDVTFDRYGVEDIEFGFRALQHGCVFVPEPGASCRHLGAPGYETPDKRSDNRRQRVWAMDLIAHPSFRPIATGRMFSRPWVNVLIPMDQRDDPSEISGSVEAVLASSLTDLRVVVLTAEGHPAREVDSAFRGDARVSVTVSGDGFSAGWDPDVPIHIELRRGYHPAPEHLNTITQALLRHHVGVAHVRIDHAEVASAWLTRAVARARLCGADTPQDIAGMVEELFGARWLPLPGGSAARQGGRWAQDDLATIRSALHRAPAPAVAAAAGLIRVAVALRRRLRPLRARLRRAVTPR
ncbi:MAG: glycosyltransferase family 2 protein [Euzebya sp.]